MSKNKAKRLKEDWPDHLPASGMIFSLGFAELMRSTNGQPVAVQEIFPEEVQGTKYPAHYYAWMISCCDETWLAGRSLINQNLSLPYGEAEIVCEDVGEEIAKFYEQWEKQFAEKR